jgi:hypothetical protein
MESIQMPETNIRDEHAGTNPEKLGGLDRPASRPCTPCLSSSRFSSHPPTAFARTGQVQSALRQRLVSSTRFHHSVLYGWAVLPEVFTAAAMASRLGEADRRWLSSGFPCEERKMAYDRAGRTLGFRKHYACDCDSTAQESEDRRRMCLLDRERLCLASTKFRHVFSSKHSTGILVFHFSCLFIFRTMQGSSVAIIFSLFTILWWDVARAVN